jgi:hypothetical protein
MTPDHAARTGRIQLRIRRRVLDFDDWRSRLGAWKQELLASGVVSYTLLRMLDDPNEVELVLRFGSIEEASAMARRIDLPESHERILFTGALEIGSLSLSEAVETVDFTAPRSSG